MKFKPVIGITADIRATDDDARAVHELRLRGNYAQAVAEAGGVPIVLPPDALPSDVLRLIDGLVIPGGNDIDPVHFGQPLHPQAELQHPLRFEAESALYREAPAELPILGICYGCQFINVMQGGTLIQHLPDIRDAQIHTGGPLQEYRLEPDSKVARAVGGAHASGRSYHHQAIQEPGEGVRVTGRATDGTVEAIEVAERAWTLAVQWHPERTLGDPSAQNLFKALIAAAASYRAHRTAQPVGA